MQKTKVAVIGSGSWATAIVKILLHNVVKVYWWVREEEIAAHLKQFKHNPRYLSYIKFDTKRLCVSDDINLVLSEADIPVFCIPSAFLHSSLQNMDASLLKNKTVVSTIKGIVPEFNDIIADYFFKQHGLQHDNFVVVSGPSHAEEVAQEKLTYLTVCSKDLKKADAVAALFACRFIRTSTSNDIIGTEYAPVMKNVYAIASGICSGLGYGDNFHAVLISNALQEISRFLEAVSPNNRDIKKSVYLGDLLVTCYSQFSRNRRFGQMLARGYSPYSAQMEMNMVAEGYYAAKCIKALNTRCKVAMPVFEAVYNILYENKRPANEIKALEKNLS
ncbi:MAG: NAD(P)H-dependent glycerol-3-phosphate dehydrogenase [Bacteroidales bacterium]|nr:NAD(P)H-dependent glycerol-3-phosphate dehydrogenase [Bacteroidales bacterium]